MKRYTPGQKNYRDMFQLNPVQLQESGETIYISVPDATGESIDELIGQLAIAAEDLAWETEQLANSYAERMDQLMREFDDDKRDIEEMAEDTINAAGDYVKSNWAENATVDYISNEEEAVVLAQVKNQVKLAKKSTKKAKDHTGAYAGAAFGVIALCAVGAMYSTCSNKKTSHTEALL